MTRSMELLVRHIPTWGGRSRKHNSRLLVGDIEMLGRALRTYLGAKARSFGVQLDAALKRCSIQSLYLLRQSRRDAGATT